MSKKRVCIIGGGVSGIISLKACLDHDNLEAVLYEKESDFGGVWNPKSGKSWNKIVTNISKYSCIFLDKPYYNMDKDIIYPKRDQVYQYLAEYIDQFGLLQNMKFNQTIEHLELKQEGCNIKWIVKIKDQKEVEEFDNVIIASGIFSVPAPSKDNDQEYLRKVKKENVHHSIGYKCPSEYKDKDVLVVGNGSSGCDIAVDLVGTARNVYHYFKRPFYIFKRIIPNPLNNGALVPFEVLFYSRGKQAANKLKSEEEYNTGTHQYFRNSLCKEQQKIEDLAVTEDLKSPCYASINDDYMSMIDNKQIKIIKNPIEFLDQQMKQKDQDDNQDGIHIIQCNGYQCRLPFLSQEIIDKIGFEASDCLQPLLLHKECWPKDVPNLAFVGLYRGTYWGTLEMQAIWVSRVFAGKILYPTELQIKNGIKEEKKIRKQLPRKQFPHNDVVHFTDSIASEIGMLPDFKQLETTDPDLYKKLWKGTYLLFGYKLFDPEIKNNEEIKSKYLKYIDDFFLEYPIK